ncbi:hypothetical protein FK498_00880 [Elioraea sp. Yellowstone]|jgi:hypothetical protein|uniref:hypothetical protein n=1 Tax=unclassified Elioraea TaxID=2619524 RepID=UPI001151B19C|nr:MULTISPECIES: hypothetical protein [unclassified Elioraea]TQF85270.1 hypothetical protein FK498_00880 [Elioraea sp. Yellowstone]GIX11559.1 MAG: hypothetical protein KatS3mg116_3269 [Elioraea sp.]
MANAPKKKVFYQIDEVCERLGLSLLDMSVLASEGKVRLCTAVPGVRVEEGHYEIAPDGSTTWIAAVESYVRGLVDLRPEDAWYVLRSGSQVIFWLAAEAGRYRRLISTSEDDRGYTVIREEVGVRHEELKRYVALEESLDDFGHGARAGGRGSQPHYDWDAARLEAFRRIYFEGVPESFGALIRHIQAWFARQGGRVPDESTLKRRLRDIWAVFGTEATQKAA